MIDSVLIANRGEIVVRIVRTLRRLDIASVAVFTGVDEEALHVEVCDAAVRVPSYLDGSALIAAAQAMRARAVHPGYGFLSENAEFARDVIAAGLTWIGPPPEAIELMGDKARAKQLARQVGMPVVPGVDGEDVKLPELETFVADHGLPIVIKAVAGGGGKGMRVVRDASELADALDAARREARSAFGDERVLAERYLDRPRHIEVQVLADAHGACIHLGERECSLQRRHQKVIEEAPSPIVDAPLRARMGEAAVALARACGYVGVGTVELIVPADGSDFYFLEMNTRLQVEHPVTELVYDVDLVEEQIRVASDAPLSFGQDAVVAHGHAIEARLYAEDPAASFLPATGTVLAYREPSRPGVRVDSGIRVGSEISTAYDPMLAKVIAHAPDRLSALARLDRALADLELLGVATNAAFSRSLLAREDVRAGVIDTGLLERVMAEQESILPEDLLPAAVWAAFHAETEALTVAPGTWWRPLVEHGDARVDAETVTVGERQWHVRGRTIESGIWVEIEGVARRYVASPSRDVVWLWRDGYQLELRTAAATTRGGSIGVGGSLEAPMPGAVLLISVSNGDVVQEGDVLLVLESMKMELSITAPHAGRVDGLELSVGDRVARGQRLVSVVALDRDDHEANADDIDAQRREAT